MELALGVVLGTVVVESDLLLLLVLKDPTTIDHNVLPLEFERVCGIIFATRSASVGASSIDIRQDTHG